MAFEKKTWADRISEYPNRRTLEKADGSSEIVTVTRAEGIVSQEGSAFSAENMNDLEERIADSLIASDGLAFKFGTDGDGNYGYYKADDSFVPFKSGGDREVSGIRCHAKNAPGYASSESYELTPIGFEKMDLSAVTYGYPGSTNQYAKCEVYENDEWRTVLERRGQYANTGTPTILNDVDITNTERIRLSAYAVGSNASAQCDSIIDVRLY